MSEDDGAHPHPHDTAFPHWTDSLYAATLISLPVSYKIDAVVIAPVVPFSAIVTIFDVPTTLPTFFVRPKSEYRVPENITVSPIQELPLCEHRRG